MTVFDSFIPEVRNVKCVILTREEVGKRSITACTPAEYVVRMCYRGVHAGRYREGYTYLGCREGISHLGYASLYPPRLCLPVPPPALVSHLL